MLDAFKNAGIDSKDFKKQNQAQKKSNETPKEKSNTPKKEVANTQSIKKDFKTSGILKLKMTAISPLHIGSGYEYEPTNYVIDENILYSFLDEDFFTALNSIDKEKFINILNENRSDSFARINSFVKERIDIVKKISKKTIPTSKGIQTDYKSKVGKVVQVEGSSSKGNYKNVFNEFKIQKIQRKLFKDKNGDYKEFGYIPGSSLKGAIATAYQEFISIKEGGNARKEKFLSPITIKEHIFKNFKVADSKVTISNYKELIGYALNKERFEDDKTGLSTILEAIEQNSTFSVEIAYSENDNKGKKLFSLNNVLNSLNSHYLPIFKTMFDDEYEYIVDYLSEDFVERYKNLELQENQFLIRVGKHSGARAVTINSKNEKRKIKVRVNKSKFEEEDEETTTWLFGKSTSDTKNLLPFGWLLCEIID